MGCDWEGGQREAENFCVRLHQIWRIGNIEKYLRRPLLGREILDRLGNRYYHEG